MVSFREGRRPRRPQEFCKRLFYQARLAVTPAAARDALLEVLESGLKSSPICVLSSREKLEEANRSLGKGSLAITDVVM